MAFELVEEVLDHAPAMLTAAEVLLLTVIAEQARKATRSADIPQDVFLRRTRLGERGLRMAFNRLEKHGLKVRIPLSHYADGRPIYAVHGRVCSYVLPPLPAPENCPCHRCKAGGTTVPPPKVGGTTASLDGTTVPSDGTTVPSDGTTVPPNQTGDPYGVSPVRSENGAARREHGGRMPPFDRNELISQLKNASRTIHAKGTRRENAFENLMSLDAKKPGADP